MSRINFSELEKIENLGAATGWVSPLSAEDKEFIKYFRSVFKRYNIDPSKATRLEYDFVTRVAESEFYLQQANAQPYSLEYSGANFDPMGVKKQTYQSAMRTGFKRF